MSRLDKPIIILYTPIRLNKGVRKGKFVEINGFQNLGFFISKDKLLKNLRADPRVKSAEYKDGEFHVNSVRGKFSFKFTAAEEESIA